MSEKLRTSVHYGRPYGGVGFLIRNSLFLDAKFVIKLPLADVYPLLSLGTGLDVNIVTVYFPRYR